MGQGKLPDGRIERQDYPTWSRVIELVDGRRQDSIRYNTHLFNRLADYYKTYRGVWQGRYAQFRNNISIPFTFAMIQSDVARKVQASFGAWPVVGFEGYAPEDASRAKRNEVLISAQMKDADSIIKAVDFFLQADICGTGIARFGWKNVTRKTRYRKMEQIAPGFEVPVVYEDESEIFDGPNWEVVDRLDFWQQPARRTIDEMDWVIHRYWADLDALKEDANSPIPYFDPRAVNALDSVPLSGRGATDYQERRLTFRDEYDYMARTAEHFSKPVEIWEYHGLVPSEFAVNGVRHRCIAVANERVVLKNREGPMPNGQKPFLSYSPMRDPYGFDGVGKAEIAYGPQRTADRINNQKLDAIDLLIDPQIVASSTANLNTQNLFSRAGRVILVDGPADDSNIRPLVMNMQGLQAAYSEISQLFQFMQLGTGETESLLGVQSGSRETARGFLGRQENALTRLSLEATLAEQGFIEPLANAFRSMDRLWLSLPHEVKIVGSLATVNPITGLPYPDERATVDYEDLVPDYRARAVGASQMLGRSIRQQNLIAIMQVLSANPAMMQIVNWANFARQAFELFDFKNVNDLLVNQVPLINQMAQNAGMSPTAAAGAVAQPMQTLDPNILGQLMNVQGQSTLNLAGMTS